MNNKCNLRGTIRLPFLAHGGCYTVDTSDLQTQEAVPLTEAMEAAAADVRMLGFGCYQDLGNGLGRRINPADVRFVRAREGSQASKIRST